MTTSIVHYSGVGANVRLAVKRDGKTVAVIYRRNLKSVYYDMWLDSGSTIEKVKEAAITRLHYPTAEEAYEHVCAEIERQRRGWIRGQLTDALADAARALAQRSNSAHDELVRLSNEIESFAKDRNDTDNVNETYIRFSYTHDIGGETYRYYRSRPLYPQPPAAKYPKRAA